MEIWNPGRLCYLLDYSYNCSVSMIIVLILLTELNCFYLKFVMWAMPDHPYVLGRLFFMAGGGAVAVREAYDYLAGIATEIGQSAWIATSIIITEAMICIKATA